MVCLISSVSLSDTAEWSRSRVVRPYQWAVGEGQVLKARCERASSLVDLRPGNGLGKRILGGSRDVEERGPPGSWLRGRLCIAGGGAGRRSCEGYRPSREHESKPLAFVWSALLTLIPREGESGEVVWKSREVYSPISHRDVTGGVSCR